MAAVLVCLLVVTLVAASLVQVLVLSHRQTDKELQHLQAFWIAEAGLHRGRRAILQDPTFSGSRWEVTLDVNGHAQQAVARIQVEAVPNQPQKRLLVVEAFWPNDSLDRSLERRELLISLPNSGGSP